MTTPPDNNTGVQATVQTTHINNTNNRPARDSSLSTQDKKSKLIVALIFFVPLLGIAASIAGYFILAENDPDSTNGTNTNGTATIVKDYPVDTEPPETITLDNTTHSTRDITYISNDNYPFDLPSDSPFGFDEMETLYEKADDRYLIIYMESSSNTEENFKAYIEPYVKLFLASSEYIFEKYGDTFMGKNPEINARNSLTIQVYEDCMDIGTGLNEETCSDIKMIGSASPFTYGVKFYANFDHPDFDPAFLIIVGSHETIHLLQYTYDTGYSSSLIPTWYKESMAEGMAYYPEHKQDLYPELFVNYEYPQTLSKLSEMYRYDNDSIENVNDKRRAYHIGMEFFNFLMTKKSLEKYLTLIPKQTSRENNQFEAEFIRIFGKGSEEMYTDFLRAR